MIALVSHAQMVLAAWLATGAVIYAGLGFVGYMIAARVERQDASNRMTD
ncbi:MAG: hypothetical protein M0Z76_02160 [Gammaproteobacteria bacterium]|nr:hypothetical protein [Gammaproteobacteria bacterium]